MTTREAWLANIAHQLDPYAAVTFLPSYPRRNARKVVLGELVNDRTRGTLGLVSPVLSDSLEVGLVVAYLTTRRAHNGGTAPRMTARCASAMTAIGWADPSRSIVPNDAIITRVGRAVDATVAELGAYPHEYVDITPTAVQTTRLLKVVCSGESSNAHDPYILRMSGGQFDRGRPGCGVCGLGMTLG